MDGVKVCPCGRADFHWLCKLILKCNSCGDREGPDILDHLLERQENGQMALLDFFLVVYMPSLYRKVSGNASFAHFKLRFAWASDGWEKNNFLTKLVIER